MAFNAEQLAQLEKAASSGKLSVQLGDRRVQYQSLSDLLEAMQLARRDVALLESKLRSNKRYPEFSRGY